MRTNPGQMASHALEDQIVKAEKNAFYGWVVSSVANIGNKGSKQLFYMSFTARFHGLSIGGMSILGSYGLMMKETSFNRVREDLLLEYKQLTE
jgi:hypothetical protein